MKKINRGEEILKLIGVTGKSGAGKTTFANILAQKNGIGVIHIDEVLRKVKKKDLKALKETDVYGEKAVVPKKFRKIMVRNKFLFDMFMNIRARIIDKEINAQINKLQSEGNRIIIIDDIYIQYLKCYKNLSKVFLIERPYIKRKESVIKRDNVEKESIVLRDMAHDSGVYKELVHRNGTIKINNNRGREELTDIAEKMYDKYFSTLQERQKCTVANENIEITKELNNSKTDIEIDDREDLEIN